MKKVIHEIGTSGLLTVCLAALLLPVGGLIALEALGVFDADARVASSSRHAGPPPAWTSPLNFMAQTGDGFPVTLEVAIDAPDGATRRALSADAAQLTLLLKLQVGSMHSSELKAPGGIEELSERMLAAVRRRVGDGAGDEPGIRQVAIGNLVVRSP
jgi:hypothetical protein